jgi:hypothetical protein
MAWQHSSSSIINHQSSIVVTLLVAMKKKKKKKRTKRHANERTMSLVVVVVTHPPARLHEKKKQKNQTARPTDRASDRPLEKSSARVVPAPFFLKVYRAYRSRVLNERVRKSPQTNVSRTRPTARSMTSA